MKRHVDRGLLRQIKMRWCMLTTNSYEQEQMETDRDISNQIEAARCCVFFNFKIDP